MTVTTSKPHARPPIWRNLTVLKWAAQIVVTSLILGFLYLIWSTGTRNFARTNITFGWDWLTTNLQFAVGEGIELQPDTGIRTILTGAINTLRVAVSGVFAATIIGTIVGVARLSGNWIVNKIATVYIETIRNIPLLVQIFFWIVLVRSWSDIGADQIGTYFIKASNKGIGVTWAFPAVGFYQWMVFVIIGLAAGRWIYRKRLLLGEDEGRETHPILWGIGAILLAAIVGWFAHPVFGFFGPIFHGIASFIDAWPAFIVPLLVAAITIGGAVWWIRNFFESRRTPAGFGKLTDDDWFRVIFTGFLGLLGAAVAFWLSGNTFELPPGSDGTVATIAELGRTGLANLFDWFGDKFHFEAGAPLAVQRPTVVAKGIFHQYGDTGLVITPAFFAIWIGVTLYTAAFIAEIVRGGIQAVSKGQTEAAQALGLRRSQYLRLIILPQAFRIIMPPMGNQYLNLFKNTSLGVAVGFPDIVSVGSTTFNQTGQSLPVLIVWMSFFLGGSLLISSVVNYYNRRLQLVER